METLPEKILQENIVLSDKEMLIAQQVCLVNQLIQYPLRVASRSSENHLNMGMMIDFCHDYLQRL
jgi:hypothetical protein